LKYLLTPVLAQKSSPENQLSSFKPNQQAHYAAPMKIVAVSNQKGGVGKTTTAVSLSAALAEMGYNILLIDTDPQASATSAVGLEEEQGVSIYPVLHGQKMIIEVIKQSPISSLHVIPSEKDLAGIEVETQQDEHHLLRLRYILEPLRESYSYEFAFLDCPPSLGVLMTCSLAAADSVLIPLQCEYLSLEGLSKILDYLERIRYVTQLPLPIEGVLMTMFDARTKLSQTVINDVRNHLGKKMFSTIIPRTVRLGEAPSYGQPITIYDPQSTGALAYRNLALEFLERNGLKPKIQTT
jgi:chromosome partitioning protein